MITIDEARELVNTTEIPFPQDWKEQMLRSVEDNIRVTARGGRKVVNVQGKVYATRAGGYNTGTFFLSPEQFLEITAVLKQNGFGVNEDFRIRFDGQPLNIDIFW
jgi:hypothetical protein